ncbi:MAG: TonB family protein [Gammaproteobacteria bacterium]
MSTPIPAMRSPVPVTPSDRLGMTLFFAVVLHAILILGVSWGSLHLKPLRSALPTIEIKLVNTRSEKAPDQPDYLAQANQEGGGMSETVASPSPSQPLPEPEPAIVPEPEPVPVPEPAPEVPVAPEPPPEPLPPVELPAPRKPDKEVITQPESPKKTPLPKTKASPAPEPEVTAPALPSASDLINRSMKIASLSAQIAASKQAYAKRPRQKFISARTQEFKYASYMEAWRAKIERFGNINYPTEAKRRNLSGSLILDVALNADGSINNITLTKSSGQKVLDDAAIDIVKFAAPYGHFPDDIKKDIDILHIVRTWQFLPGNRLSGK